MIRSVTIQKGERGLFTNKLYIKGGKPRVFEFDEGVNVITGRNGSGKSVLLNIIKTLCCISDGTHAYMLDPMKLSKSLFWDGPEDERYYTYPEYAERELRNKGYPKASLDWDGNITHHLTSEYFSSENRWHDFTSPWRDMGKQELFGMGEYLSNKTSSASSGEAGIRLLMQLNGLLREYPPANDHKYLNDVWVAADNAFQNWVASHPKDGKPTLLIDELDARLDLDNQKTYWDYIKHLTKMWQVIVVSHSYFAFQVEGVNHIPLNKEYFNNVRKL